MGGILTCEDDLSGHEDQEHDLWLNHAVDEAREELGLVLHWRGEERGETMRCDKRRRGDERKRERR